MTIIEIFILAVAVAIDAFVAAVCLSVKLRKDNVMKTILISLSFGFFQFLMPVIGYYLARILHETIDLYDHFIAFILLLYLGLKNITLAVKDYVKEKKTNKEKDIDEIVIDMEFEEDNVNGKEKKDLSLSELFVLSIATSLDAMAVGITISFSAQTIWLPAAVAGIVTFALSCFGVLIGKTIGLMFNKYANILAGITLIGIGIKILIEGIA